MFRLVAIIAIVAVASADVAFLERKAQPQFRILKQKQHVDPSGSYRWAYETENGISAQESGLLQYSRTSQESGTAAQGSYSYTSPEGIPIAITYVADENGFQPQGDAIPTPPPIPAAILKSLEYIRSNPQPTGQRKFRF